MNMSLESFALGWSNNWSYDRVSDPNCLDVKVNLTERDGTEGLTKTIPSRLYELTKTRVLTGIGEMT